MKTIYDPVNDPQFDRPYLDVDEARCRTTSAGHVLPYRYVHGGFKGTNVRFSFCFPPEECYQHRFFQHLSPFPSPTEELAPLEAVGEEDHIAFAISHGSAFVSCNMGSTAIFSGSSDASLFYRSNAAAAMQCRRVAQDIYGAHRMYGYVFGGSGGGYKAMSCIENTNQYDGAVPFVIGSPMSLPSCLTVPAFGARRLRHCWHTILDHVDAGGDGKLDVGLTADEADALREIVRMGYPPRMVRAFASPAADGSLAVLIPGVKAMDAAYFDDFWHKPGYEGYEHTDGVWDDLTDFTARVVEVGLRSTDAPDGIDSRNGTDTAWQKMLSNASESYMTLTDVPHSDYLVGIDMTILTGAAAGKVLRLGRVDGHRVIPGMTFGADTAESVLALLHPGDEVRLSNRDYLAIQHYHRHQVPDDASFRAWNQYRESGWAQRPVIAYQLTAGGCGSVQDGQIQGKVIVMNSLLDSDFPWQADWYVQKVREAHGGKADDLIRIWYNDNCPHADSAAVEDDLHCTSYLGMLHQALLDVSAWVEDGIEPPPSSGYEIRDQQVVLADTAQERQGIQPVVSLTADGQPCLRIKSGETVSLAAHVDLTARMGEVISCEWRFEGEADWQIGSVNETHCYQHPGVYFPTVRVTAGRNPQDTFCRLRNLGSARIIVEA